MGVVGSRMKKIWRRGADITMDLHCTGVVVTDLLKRWRDLAVNLVYYRVSCTKTGQRSTLITC